VRVLEAEEKEEDEEEEEEEDEKDEEDLSESPAGNEDERFILIVL
jgi:hypothetical protein